MVIIERRVPPGSIRDDLLTDLHALIVPRLDALAQPANIVRPQAANNPVSLTGPSPLVNASLHHFGQAQSHSLEDNISDSYLDMQLQQEAAQNWYASVENPSFADNGDLHGMDGYEGFDFEEESHDAFNGVL
jgi:hypothetical protein